MDESILFSLGFLSQNSLWKLPLNRGYKGIYIVGWERMWKVIFCQTGCSGSLTSRLGWVASSSREPPLFCWTWRFTLLSHSSINTPFTHEYGRASRENFERETPEKTRLTHPQSLPKRLFKFLYSLPLHCQILERLITKTFSHHIHFCERAVWCFGKQLGRNQFHISWCYGQAAESGKLEKK